MRNGVAVDAFDDECQIRVRDQKVNGLRSSYTTDALFVISKGCPEEIEDLSMQWSR